ncbi:hypothetical protein C8F04DRAFT_1129516 [Mycena alexandri]|uniref:DUF7330 domain-containing protein n=1 Tax=Mycena alexandri TaxID=1745969 RepID=A0AAD6WS80_9AGAR|nr:hypothetical protein C8F04DRAFT_1129516 [Mycena alexandri]
MTQTDVKETALDATPIPAQSSVPPPYDPLPVGGNGDAGMFTRPGNNMVVTQTFGALRGMHFTIDPNIHLPKSLLPRPHEISVHPKPRPNLKLGVEFGAIEAVVDVLPLTAAPPENPRRSMFDQSNLDNKVYINASTTTGNITLSVKAPTTPVVVVATSTFGHVRIYLSRTMHGPLTLSSSLRAPRLSPALRRSCTPLRQEGDKTNWFVGDIGAWSAKDEMGDQVKVESQFGSVWVGYVGEEEAVAKRAVPVGLQVSAHSAGASMLLWAAYWVLVRFFAWQMV